MGGVAVAQVCGKASYKLDILEGDGGAENAQRMWQPKVCTKLCFSIFVCEPVFCGRKGMFYVFMFLEAVPVCGHDLREYCLFVRDVGQYTSI